MIRRGDANILLAVLLGFLLMGGLIWVNYGFARQNPGGNDFLARWMGARMWLMEGISPYDPQVSLATQEIIYGRPADPAKGEDEGHFVYPLYSMLFFGPFGLLEYLPARTLWMSILEICLILLVFLGIRLVQWRPPIWLLGVVTLFSVMWYHGARTIVIGQFAGLNALLILLALLSIRRQQDAAAGILLALTTTKPQMVFLFVPFVLLWAWSVQRKRILWGFLGGFFGLMIVSLLLLPRWPFEMLAQILDYPTYTNLGSPLSILAAYVPGLRQTLDRGLHVFFLLYLSVEWVQAWGKGERWFTWTALMTLVITNLVAFRTATTNFVALLPVLLLVFGIWEDRWKITGRTMVILLLLALGFGLWGLFLATVDGNIESAEMYLPIPLLCLVSLGWVRWWAIRPRRLLLEELAVYLE